MHMTMTLFSLQIALLMIVDNFDYCLFYDLLYDLYDLFVDWPIITDHDHKAKENYSESESSHAFV